MELSNFNVRELNKRELEEIDGGLLGVIIAGAALLVSAAVGGLAYAYYNGYNDAKEECPPPPCK